MSMKVIALTSANEPAMKAVAAQLLSAASTRSLALSVMVGARTAADAIAVCTDHGELWRIGVDESAPELDILVDRTIDDSPDTLSMQVAYALDTFLAKDRRASATPAFSVRPLPGGDFHVDTQPGLQPPFHPV